MFEFKIKKTLKNTPMDSDQLYDFIEENKTFIFYGNEGELFHVFFHESSQEYLIISEDSLFCERTLRAALDRIEDNASALILDVTIFAKELTLTIE